MHIHVCLLFSMLYLHVSLPRYRFCHALYPLWVCAYVFTSVPPRVCLDVTTWRYTFKVLECLFYTFLHSVRCWYACLAFFTPPVWLSLLLCILACLPTCSCMSLFVIHTSIQWNYGHWIQTYICPLRIIEVWLSWSMSPSDIGFLVYATRINMLDALKGFNSSEYKHVNACHIHKFETLLVRHNAPNAKLFRIFSMKMGHPHCCIFTLKAWWE